MKSFESNWESGDGITFFVQGWEPDHAKPKALIALVHGLGEHTARFAHVAKAMTDAGCAMAGFDLRGHGKSGGPRGHTPSLEAYIQDVHQFLQGMNQRYPGIPHFLYGHSLGALISLVYTIQYGVHLKGVVVTSTPLRDALQKQKVKLAVVRLLGSVLPNMAMVSGLDRFHLSHDLGVVEAYHNDPLVHYSITLGFGRAGLRAVDFCFAHAREFPVPLLMMHGTADQIAYSSGSEAFAQLVREAGGDVTLKLWEDLYHEVHNEPEKADVFKFMIEWLEKHL